MVIIHRPEIDNLFVAILQPGSADWLLALHGGRGLGKTTQLCQLKDHIPAGWCVLWLDLTELQKADALNQERFSAAAGQVLLPLLPEAYRTTLADDQRGLQNLLKRNLEQIPQMRGMLPLQPGLRESAATNLFAVRSGLLHLLAEAWFEALEHLPGPLVCLVDHWDKITERGEDDDFYSWLVQEWLLGMRQRLPTTRVVIAGRADFLNHQPWQHVDGLQSRPLQPFSLEQSAPFLSGAGVADGALQNIIWKACDGHPACMAEAARFYKQMEDQLTPVQLQAECERIASSDFYRLIKELDAESRLAVLKGAVLPWWQLEMLQYMCASAEYDQGWLEMFLDQYSYLLEGVTPPYAFKQDLRAIHARQLWQQQKVEFQQLHARAFDWFQKHTQKGLSG